MPRAVALYGGSFDPPHLGHVLAAAMALAIGQVDELRVLPVVRHPYAKPLRPFADRLALCRAAFAGLASTRVCEDELDNPSGYTIDLIERFSAREPDVRWHLVGGTDTARDLVNWHRGSDLMRLVAVIAIPRRGFDDHEAALPAIASRDLRARLARGERITGLVPAAVEALIAEHGWYR